MRLARNVYNGIEVWYRALVKPRRRERGDKPGIQIAEKVCLKFDDIGHRAPRSRLGIGMDVQGRHQKDR